MADPPGKTAREAELAAICEAAAARVRRHAIRTLVPGLPLMYGGPVLIWARHEWAGVLALCAGAALLCMWAAGARACQSALGSILSFLDRAAGPRAGQSGAGRRREGGGGRAADEQAEGPPTPVDGEPEATGDDPWLRDMRREFASLRRAIVLLFAAIAWASATATDIALDLAVGAPAAVAAEELAVTAALLGALLLMLLREIFSRS